MASLISRLRAGRDADQGDALQRPGTGVPNGQSIHSTAWASGAYTYVPMKVRDPNAPDHRLLLNSKCIYERRLPGNAYITCHVERLQAGFYDSPSIHESTIEHVRFVTLHFVFHPASSVNRFTSAMIKVSVRNAGNGTSRTSSRQHPRFTDAQIKSQTRQNPSIIRHAPHLLYGAISPETLQWNFNMSGSIGVAHGPANASLSPSAGIRGSYKLYEMMKIQGSARTYQGHIGPDDDVEDGEVVWTLEENRLQKSGLPREFTFVILLQKGDPESNVVFGLHIDPVVSNSVGHYPNWYMNLHRYRPLPKPDLNLDYEIGQKFEPTVPGRGYNFASLICSLEEFISLPGTTYSPTDQFGNATNQNLDTAKTPAPRSLQNGRATKPSGQGEPAQGCQASDEGQQNEQPPAQQQQQSPTPRPQSQPQVPQHSRAASVPPLQSQAWQGPTSLFPDNTLNVRVYVEKAPSPVHSPNRPRDVSARRPHSLRRSRSRDGLTSEYSTSAAQDAAIALSQTTRTQDAALAHIQSTRMSAASVPPDHGSSGLASPGSRAPFRRSYAEKMKEMEERIRELDKMEKREKREKEMLKQSPKQAYKKLNGVEKGPPPERRASSKLPFEYVEDTDEQEADTYRNKLVGSTPGRKRYSWSGRGAP